MNEGQRCYDCGMAISDSFRKAADVYTGTLDSEITDAMQAKGYVFLSHSWTNDDPPRPTENWETLVEKLGGEEAIDAEFDSENDPAFTVTHSATCKSVRGNGSVNVLAELWLMLN